MGLVDGLPSGTKVDVFLNVPTPIMLIQPRISVWRCVHLSISVRIMFVLLIVSMVMLILLPRYVNLHVPLVTLLNSPKCSVFYHVSPTMPSQMGHV